MTNMIDIINYIMNNFVWVIVAVIIILLVIIGAYADRTNFGEGKKIVKVKKKEKDKDIIDEIEVEKHDEPVKNDLDEMLNTKEEDKKIEDKNETKDITVDLNQEKEEKIEESGKELSKDEFLESNDLDILLPKKDILNDDLLQEIDDISFDFKKKKSLSSVPDLDDLELPNIKKKNTTNDIWK